MCTGDAAFVLQISVYPQLNAHGSGSISRERENFSRFKRRLGIAKGQGILMVIHPFSALRIPDHHTVLLVIALISRCRDIQE